jgi:DNA-binding winged helix-turn-helix (wHTH) protein
MLSPQASPTGKIIRFGVFEADLATGELRKDGVRVRLQEQPFQLLAYLLERPGKMVTREDLQRKLWPGDTFVDFAHSLNTAVNKIRDALGDSASAPACVETVARRGYRFIGAIDPQAATSSPSLLSPSETPERKSAAFHSELNIPLPNRAVPRALFALVQVMYAVFYLEALFHWRGADSALTLYLPASAAWPVLAAMFVTAAVGIALRCYFISAISFDYQYLRINFERMFIAVLFLDELWALSPFLAADKIGFGLAFAATAALLYVPFSERTLLRMAYPAKS